MLHVNGKYRAAKYLNAIHCFKRSDLISQPKKIERLRRITFLGVMDPAGVTPLFGEGWNIENPPQEIGNNANRPRTESDAKLTENSLLGTAKIRSRDSPLLSIT
jgi:hypothetical protein